MKNPTIPQYSAHPSFLLTTDSSPSYVLECTLLVRTWGTNYASLKKDASISQPVPHKVPRPPLTQFFVWVISVVDTRIAGLLHSIQFSRIRTALRGICWGFLLLFRLALDPEAPGLTANFLHLGVTILFPTRFLLLLSR